MRSRPARPSPASLTVTELDYGDLAASWPQPPDACAVYVRVRLGIEPVAKERPRVVTAKSGKKHAFTPEKTAKFEESVGGLLLAGRVRCNSTDSLGVHVTFHVRQSWPGRATAPDADNYLKALFDACNRVAWGDDRQVKRITTDLVSGSDDPHIDFFVYVLHGRSDS